MASAVKLRVFSGNGATLTPPRAPVQKHSLGRYCVKVTTNVLDKGGNTRFVLKGYGPDEDLIKEKTLRVRDMRCRQDDVGTDPLVTTVPICDVCDNRVEIFDVPADEHFFIM